MDWTLFLIQAFLWMVGIILFLALLSLPYVIYIGIKDRAIQREKERSEAELNRQRAKYFEN